VIVDPFFLQHPKTLTLSSRLNDPVAPLYLIRLWCYCQTQKTPTPRLSPEFLKIVCGYPGNANRLESALTTSGFIRRDGETVEVVNWAEHNAKLISSWSNGKKGGRPKKSELESKGGSQGAAQKTKGAEKENGVKSREKSEKKTQTKPKEGEEEIGVIDKTRYQNAPDAPAVDVDPDPPDSDVGPIEHVFAHYRKHHPKRFRKIHDGLKEWKLIEARIEKDGFTVMELCDAIDGCHVSPHHTGQNERGEVYDSLELIMRDAKHVQQFIGYYESRGRPVISPKTQRTIFAAEQFAESWTKDGEVSSGVGS
jgi:hypothetical protein